MPKHIDWYNAAGERFCDVCRCYMPLDLFHRNRSSRVGDGYQRYCKVCSRAIRHRHYERNKEREIAYARAWQNAHPARVRVTHRRALRVHYRLKKLARQAREAQRIEREEQAG